MQINFPIACIFGLSFLACNHVSNSNKTTQVEYYDDAVSGGPAEISNSYAPYKNALEGQTRACKLVTPTLNSVESIAKNIGNSWAIIPLNEARLLISDKSGFISIYDLAGNMLKKITGLPEVLSKGQGSFPNILIDSSFNKDRLIYFAFAEKYGQGNTTTLAKELLTDDELHLDNINVIYRVDLAMDSDKHFGAGLVFDKEMTIYKGEEIPEWKNNLFINEMNSLHLSRMVIANNKVVGKERLFADKKERIRDVVYSDGKLYVVTDGGILFKIGRQ